MNKLNRLNKLTSKAGFILYLLTFVIFFIAGGLFVKLTGAAEGQGFAGGAIVFFYGVLFAFAGLIASVIFVHYANHGAIVLANRLLLIVFVIFLGILTFNYLSMPENPESIETPKKVTVPSGMLINAISNFSKERLIKDENDKNIGLGFFKPDFFEKKVMYFYSDPIPGKSVPEHPPTDSIGFSKTENGGFEISYAPPWLVPEHLKLDYDILYFKIQSVTDDFAEVVVNTGTQQTFFVDRSAGKIIYWPDFLLQVHSVEFTEPGMQKVRVKPLSYAGEDLTAFQIMKPVMVKDEWMLVELLNDNYDHVGQGWIQWKKDNQLLITYSLLS